MFFCFFHLLSIFFRIRYIKKIGDKMKVTEIVLNDCVSKIYGLMVLVTKIPGSHGKLKEKRVCALCMEIFSINIIISQ